LLHRRPRQLIERKMISLLAKRVEIEATDSRSTTPSPASCENNLDAEGLKKRRIAGPELGLPKRIAEEIVQQKVLADGAIARRSSAQIRKLDDQRWRDACGSDECTRAHGGGRGGRQAPVAAACDKVRVAWRGSRGREFRNVASQVCRRALISVGCRRARSRRGCRKRRRPRAGAGVRRDRAAGRLRGGPAVERRKVSADSSRLAAAGGADDGAGVPGRIRALRRTTEEADYVERKGASPTRRPDVASPPPTIR
jgi:hypothetical protein